MLARAMKMAFWVSYDHLGKFLVVGLLWSLALLAPGWAALVALLSDRPGMRLFVGVPLAAFSFGIATPVLTAGLAHMVKVLIDQKDGSLSDFTAGVKQYAPRAAILGLLFLFAAASLVTSTWFYAAKLHDIAPWLGYALSALAAWCLVFLGLMALFAMPTLVQKKGGIRETLKLSALLVLANPGFSLGLAVQLLALTAFSLAVFPFFVFLYGPLAMALTGSAYEMLARKYAAAAVEAGAPPEEIPPFPDDEDDDYLNRGFRDFLFPWKG